MSDGTRWPRRRVIAWLKEPPNEGAEWAEIVLRADRLAARGVAIGGRPVPYRLEYALATERGFATRRLRVQARGDGWRRGLDLRRSPDGRWTVDTIDRGKLDLPAPGGELGGLDDAVDCDLGLSPTTNTMPVLRHRLLAGEGAVDLLMAWISVPDLSVRPLRQRYTFLRHDEGHTLIRYESGAFSSDLRFDPDGLVLDYPQLGRQLGDRP